VRELFEYYEAVRQIQLKGNPRILVVGSGIGGLCMAAKLKMAGVERFKVFEKASGLGGTWRDNTYPGVACDIPSTIYDLSFFLNPDWSGTSAPGAEILAYLHKLVAEYGLEECLSFNKKVVGCRYDDGLWRVETDDGRVENFDVVISATGFLHVPVVPKFEGLDHYQGALFHSSTWDHSVDIRNKAVGIVGTGASGVQIIPAIVDSVEELLVFQRTAQWMLPYPHEKFSSEQLRERRSNPSRMLEQYSDFMKFFIENFGGGAVGDEQGLRAAQEACEANLASVRDPQLKKCLTPNYTVLCKRIVWSNQIYGALEKPNCKLVSEQIVRFRPDGIETSDGKLHKLDVVVMCTGFDAHVYCKRLGVLGVGGKSLEDAWADGCASFETHSVAGFPNFFMVGGPFSPVGNAPFTLAAELSSSRILELLKLREDAGAKAIVVTQEAQNKFVQDLHGTQEKSVWLSGCQSWYLNRRGDIEIWSRTPSEFIDVFRRAPDLADYQLM